MCLNDDIPFASGSGMPAPTRPHSLVGSLGDERTVYLAFSIPGAEMLPKLLGSMPKPLEWPGKFAYQR